MKSFLLTPHSGQYSDYLHCPVEFGDECIEYRMPLALRSVTNATANVAMYGLTPIEYRNKRSGLRPGAGSLLPLSLFMVSRQMPTIMNSFRFRL